MMGLPHETVAAWLARRERPAADSDQPPFLVIDIASGAPASAIDAAGTADSEEVETEQADDERQFGEVSDESLVFRLDKSADAPYADRILIGRAPNIDISLDLLTVSRLQISIARRDGAWVAKDLGSTNGTRVDGEILRNQESLVIDDGSEMRLGPDVRALFYTSAGFAALLEELSKSRMG